MTLDCLYETPTRSVFIRPGPGEVFLAAAVFYLWHCRLLRDSGELATLMVLHIAKRLRGVSCSVLLIALHIAKRLQGVSYNVPLMALHIAKRLRGVSCSVPLMALHIAKRVRGSPLSIPRVIPCTKHKQSMNRISQK